MKKAAGDTEDVEAGAGPAAQVAGSAAPAAGPAAPASS